MIFLIGCTGMGSGTAPGVCPPVVAYNPTEQAQVADEVAALPEGAAIVGWLADYAVMREQARICKNMFAKCSFNEIYACPILYACRYRGRFRAVRDCLRP
jgi:hypothetical protein